MSVHAFVDSGNTRTDASGRRLRVCAVCDKVNIGTTHRAPAEAGMDELVETVIADVLAPQPSRERELLVLALDIFLALPPDTQGFRVGIRARDLRDALDKPDWVPQPERPDPTPIVSHSQPSQVVPKRGVPRGIKDANMREMTRRALRDGWDIIHTGSGHYRLERGDDRLVFAGTPSDSRAWRNTRAMAKRKGIDVSDL